MERCACPINTSDYASYLLQAQNSGAQVLGLANAGSDFMNSLKAANDFGILKTMKPAALLAEFRRLFAIGGNPRKVAFSPVFKRH